MLERWRFPLPLWAPEGGGGGGSGGDTGGDGGGTGGGVPPVAGDTADHGGGDGDKVGSGEGDKPVLPDDKKPAKSVLGDTKPDADKPLDLKALKMPEGLKADDPKVKDFLEKMSAKDLSPQARAQSLLDMHAQIVRDLQKAPMEAWKQTRTQWTQTVAKDPDLGTGDEKNPLKPEVKTAISKVLDAYGSDDLRQALDLTGAGDNPAIIRAFAKIAKVLTEGSHVAGQPAGQSGGSRNPAERMFPELAGR